MLLKLLNSLKICPHLTSVKLCALPASAGSWALMPEGGDNIVKHYTDGHKIHKTRLSLHYKTTFSPSGDKDYQAENLMNEVTDFINSNEFEGFISVDAHNYTLYDTHPSETVYSIKLTVTYIK